MHRFSFGLDRRRLSHLRGTVSIRSESWTHRDSNPGHPPCKGGTLPLSYGPTSTPEGGQSAKVLALVVLRCPIGQTDGRSNVECVAQRATRGEPGTTAWSRSVEVIQPQIPLRLPCYDLSPLAEPRFDLCYRGLIRTPLGCFDGRCVQGAGTYSPRPSEARLLPNPAS